MTPFSFQLLATDPCGARRGRMVTAHGTVETPVFMPVGTAATVKAMTPGELRQCGAKIILGNTYHLFLRPGHERIASLGGLHRFMNWDGAILTDSGGFQVYSLGALRRISEEGVAFQSHLDGSPCFLSPEKVMEIQQALGSDIMMQFDECPPYPAERDYVARSMELSLRWGSRCLAAKNPDDPAHALFAIVQGGMHADLRRASAQALAEHPYDGFALGGLSVGEPKELMAEVLSYAPALLPVDKPRYLMGVGTPADLVRAVGQGVDMFDCVLPTRNARNGQMFTWEGKISIKQPRHRDDPQPPDRSCGCETCRGFSRAYLHHLYRCKEILGHRLMTLHNIHFYQELMRRMGVAVEEGRFASFQREFLARYDGAEEEGEEGGDS